MYVKVTMCELQDSSDEIRIYCDEPLCSVVEPGVGYATEAYFRSLDKDLTPLGRAVVNHLCRGLQGISVRASKDGNGCQVVLVPQGPTAADLYWRMCSRICSAHSNELPLHVVLKRDLGEAVDVLFKVHTGV